MKIHDLLSCQSSTRTGRCLAAHFLSLAPPLEHYSTPASFTTMQPGMAAASLWLGWPLSLSLEKSSSAGASLSVAAVCSPVAPAYSLQKAVILPSRVTERLVMEVGPSCSGRRMLELVREYCFLGMPRQAVAAAALRQGDGHRCVFMEFSIDGQQR